MIDRHSDGSAGDANYGAIGGRYRNYRQPEPRIEAVIRSYLREADTVLNVGAGAGSYEPVDKHVTAVEPSATMRSQRPSHLPAAIDAPAEALPFPDASFAASMATFTIHQWQDLSAGLKEMRRVTRGPILLLSCKPDEVQRFWLNDYASEVLATEARRYPSTDRIATVLGAGLEAIPVPIPLDCRDGFTEAYYGRPEMPLDPAARQSCSAWSFVPEAVAAENVAHLESDLKSGAWDRSYGHLRRQPEYMGSLYLFVSEAG